MLTSLYKPKSYIRYYMGIEITSICDGIRNRVNVHYAGQGVDCTFDQSTWWVYNTHFASMKQRITGARKIYQANEAYTSYIIATVT